MSKPRKNAEYKILQNVDISSNSIYNVDSIIGKSYDSATKQDLTIATFDQEYSQPSGDVVIRGGKSADSSNNGKVYILAGTDTKPNEASTLDVVNGIIVKSEDSDTVIIRSNRASKKGKKGNIDIDATNSLSADADSISVGTTTGNTITIGNEGNSEITENANKLTVKAITVTETEGTKTSTVDTLTKYQAGKTTEGKYTFTVTADKSKSTVNVDEVTVDTSITVGTSESKANSITEYVTTETVNVGTSYSLTAPNNLSIISGDSESKIVVNDFESKLDSTFSNIKVTGKVDIDSADFDITGKKSDDSDDDSFNIAYTSTNSSVKANDVTANSNLTTKNFTVTDTASSKTNKVIITAKEGTEVYDSLSVTGGNNNTFSLVTEYKNGESTVNQSKVNVDDVIVDKSLSIGTSSDKATVSVDASSLNVNSDSINISATGDNAGVLSITNNNTEHKSEVKAQVLISTENVDFNATKITGDFTVDNDKDIDTNKTTEGTVSVTTDSLTVASHKKTEITLSNGTDDVLIVNTDNNGSAADKAVVKVTTENVTDTLYAKNVKTTHTESNVTLTSDGTSEGEKIANITANSKAIRVEGGNSDTNLIVASSMTAAEALANADSLTTDSYIKADNVRVEKSLYANDFHMYWDNATNSLVFEANC